MREAFKGTIPWSVKEFNAIMEWEQKLMQHPEGEYTLPSKPGLDVDLEDEGLVTIKFNEQDPIAQLSDHFFSQYGPDIGLAHVSRYILIKEFLRKYIEKLKHAGLVKEWGSHIAVDSRVMRVLCENPYTKQHEEVGLDFDYDDIVAAAKELHDD